MVQLCRLVVLCALVTAPVLSAADSPQSPHARMKADAGAACLACHKKVAERAVVHVPVAAATCEDCHTDPDTTGKIGLRSGATRDNTAPICITCHTDVGGTAKLPGAHPPAAAGDCAGCHDPHGADAAALLSSSAADLCLSCHDTVASAVKQASPHAPAPANCTLCHDAHGTPHRRQLRAAVNLLCQSCHLGTPSSADMKSAFLQRELPEAEVRFVRDARRISLDPLARHGHPTASHPVAASEGGAGNTPLTCVSCHQPHGASTRQLFQFGARGAMDLCISCHK
jgi:predicted CXXCH cytochrome family protein